MQLAYTEKTTEIDDTIKKMRKYQQELGQSKTKSKFIEEEMTNIDVKCAALDQSKEKFKNLKTEYKDLIK